MKNIFKRTTVICLVLTMMLALIGCTRQKVVKQERVSVKTEEVDWNDSKFKKLLPKPEFEEIIILGEHDNWFGFESVTVTREQGDAYVEECKARGFTVEPVQYDGSWYWAKNAEGYELEINYGETWFKLYIDSMSVE